MAFFKKLRERMFRSSSKLDEGLEAIVQEGGTADAPPSEPPTEPPSDPSEEARGTEPPEAPRPPEPSSPETRSSASATAEAAAERAPAPPADLPAGPKIPDGPDKPRVQQEVPKDAIETEPDLPPEEARPVPEPVPEAERTSAEAPPAPPAPVSEAVPDAPLPPEPVPEPAADPLPAELPDTPEPAAARPGLIGRLLGRGEPAPKAAEAPSAPPEPVVRRALDDDMLEQLEELLISSDMGVDTAMRVTANLAEGRMGRRLSTGEIKRLLAEEIATIMEPVARPLPLYARKPQVVLVVGVNGSGKTTTIGKLASQFRAAGKKVVVAAGDTFRAAAVEQLQIWGERAGVPVMTAPEGSDPASLAFDAMARAEAEGADLLMIDTAGRLQNRADLMEELAKIVRVIRKRDPDAPHNTLLVLDATTGQNALSQVETFQKLADVSGLVMTKLDGTARGGVLVALADKFGLPIHAIGVGEQIDDLAPFDPEDFAAALTGSDA